MIFNDSAQSTHRSFAIAAIGLAIGIPHPFADYYLRIDAAAGLRWFTIKEWCATISRV